MELRIVGICLVVAACHVSRPDVDLTQGQVSADCAVVIMGALTEDPADLDSPSFPVRQAARNGIIAHILSYKGGLLSCDSLIECAADLEAAISAACGGSLQCQFEAKLIADTVVNDFSGECCLVELCEDENTAGGNVVACELREGVPPVIPVPANGFECFNNPAGGGLADVCVCTTDADPMGGPIGVGLP